ncbi:MAG TPA: DoxX family protein [Terriglobales bacterium]|jgi:putative oxidoreductase|nr:DoxX family protein [Terriglobales bacterium]
MRTLFRLSDRLTPLYTFGQSIFLLFIRLYWGLQLVQNGWGKLHHLDKVTQYFQSINVPMPGMTAHLVALLEFGGGLLLASGLASRAISAILTINLISAYYFGDHEALLSFFSDPGKFYAADPFTFLFVAIIVLLFGPGFLSLDALIRKLMHAPAPPHRA